ncbi:hypothetical protein F5B20DRAFT_93426 [Whalleya microplaca]|nr:hypothetical protein F5B20DRAFT_93426 [Whalleya microplaca]
MVEGNVLGESNALQIQIPCIVFFALTPVFLAIRIWSRLKTRSGLGWDDWTIIVSWIFAQTVSGLLVAACTYGFGQHLYNLSDHNRLLTLKLYYIAQAFYKVTLNLTKASILLLYLRIFVQKWFKVTCYVLLAIILSYMLATTASSIWQCTPIARAWDKSIPGTCISITVNWYANAGFSIATDIIILGLPMQPIYQSKLPTKQKWALMVVFALGIFVTVTSILRMQTLDFSSTSSDPTYDITSSIWTVIEDNVALICACLPMCKGVLNWLFPTIFQSSSSHTGSKSSGTGASCSNNSSWTPGRGDRGRLSTRVTSVQAARNHHQGLAADGDSEEYMLEGVGVGSGGGRGTGRGSDAGIRKITEYEIMIQSSGSSKKLDG